MIRTAIISPCGFYRYALGRLDDGMPLTDSAGTVLFCLANPSVADAIIDDRTITRCWRYAMAWGYTQLLIANVNPHRSTDPANAIMPPEAVLAENDTHLRFAAHAADLIVCAWGTISPPALVARAMAVLRCQKPLHYLELSKDGIPKHPLYLRGDIKPTLWRYREAA